MTKAKRITWASILVTLGLMLSLLESLVPLPIPFPGVKLGLANLIVLIGFAVLSPVEVFLVSAFRVFLVGLLFGGFSSMLYAAFGALLSYLLMGFTLWRLKDKVSQIGVSIMGAIGHNVGQIGAAMLMLGTTKILSYLPILMISGIITGFATGFVANALLRHLKKMPGLNASQRPISNA